MLIGCPGCGAELDLAVVLEDEEARRFHALLIELPAPMVRPTVRYLGLFRPAKRRLRWSRMVRLISEIAPMIAAARVRHGYATYVAPPEAWAQAMMSLVETPPASLQLPLRSNRYLLAMLAGQCEKSAAAAEEQQIQAARSRSGDRDQALRHISDIKETGLRDLADALESCSRDRDQALGHISDIKETGLGYLADALESRSRDRGQALKHISDIKEARSSGGSK